MYNLRLLIALAVGIITVCGSGAAAAAADVVQSDQNAHLDVVCADLIDEASDKYQARINFNLKQCRDQMENLQIECKKERTALLLGNHHHCPASSLTSADEDAAVADERTLPTDVSACQTQLRNAKAQLQAAQAQLEQHDVHVERHHRPTQQTELLQTLQSEHDACQAARDQRQHELQKLQHEHKLLHKKMDERTRSHNSAMTAQTQQLQACQAQHDVAAQHAQERRVAWQQQVQAVHDGEMAALRLELQVLQRRNEWLEHHDSAVRMALDELYLLAVQPILTNTKLGDVAHFVFYRLPHHLTFVAGVLWVVASEVVAELPIMLFEATEWLYEHGILRVWHVVEPTLVPLLQKLPLDQLQQRMQPGWSLVQEKVEDWWVQVLPHLEQAWQTGKSLSEQAWQAIRDDPLRFKLAARWNSSQAWLITMTQQFGQQCRHVALRHRAPRIVTDLSAGLQRHAAVVVLGAETMLVAILVYFVIFLVSSPVKPRKSVIAAPRAVKGFSSETPVASR